MADPADEEVRRRAEEGRSGHGRQTPPPPPPPQDGVQDDPLDNALDGLVDDPLSQQQDEGVSEQLTEEERQAAAEREANRLAQEHRRRQEREFRQQQLRERERYHPRPGQSHTAQDASRGANFSTPGTPHGAGATGAPPPYDYNVMHSTPRGDNVPPHRGPRYNNTLFVPSQTALSGIQGNPFAFQDLSSTYYWTDQRGDGGHPQLNIIPPAPRLYPQVPTAPPPAGGQPGLAQLMHQMSMGPPGAERFPSRETPVFYTDARTPMPPRQRPQFTDYANSHRMLAPDHNPWTGRVPPDARRWSTTYENYDGSLAPSHSTRPPPSIHYGPSQGYSDDNYVGDLLFDHQEETQGDLQPSSIPAIDNNAPPSTQPAGPPASAASSVAVVAAQGAVSSNQPPAGSAAPPASVAAPPRTGGIIVNRPPAASAAALPAMRQVRAGDGTSLSQAQLAAAYHAMQQRAPIMAPQAQPTRYYNHTPAYGNMGYYYPQPQAYPGHVDPGYYQGYEGQPYYDGAAYQPSREPIRPSRRFPTPRPPLPPTPGAHSQYDLAPDNPPPAARGQDYAPRLRAELWNADPLDVPAIHVADYLAGHFQSLRPDWGKDLHSFVGHFSKPGNVWKDYCGTTGQTLREWKIIFEDTANILCIPKILWAMGARLRMTGAARKKLTQEDPSSYWSYNEMCRRLADEFDRTARPALLAALHNKKQKQNEPVGAYCARVMDAFLQAYPEQGILDMPAMQSTLASQVITGALPELQAMLGMDMFTYQTFSDAKAALTTAKMTYDHMTGVPLSPRGRPLARVTPQGAAAPTSRSPSSERTGPTRGILNLPKQVRFNPNPRINALQTKEEDNQQLTRKEIEDYWL